MKHKVYTCGDLEMDVDARFVRAAGRMLPLTYAEFEILRRMLRDPGRVFTRAELSGRQSSSPKAIRSVDIHISRLRRKVAAARSFAIETVPHVGYRCRDVSGSAVAERETAASEAAPQLAEPPATV